MKKRVLSAVWVWCLAACMPALPQHALPNLQAQQVLWFQADKLDAYGNVEQTALLSVQGGNDGRSRWLLSDAFGAPIARMNLSARGWQQDGFAPPNRNARRLFEQMLPLLQQEITGEQTLGSGEGSWLLTPITETEENGK